ncbi:hypothetical protein SETIT_3G327500v2 [Setaria italica]|uniref:Cytochrome P450 n=1 Tax=Setaria italica TaxID=4555 RepID=A0A368QL97_SETIT|nr:hypothetical protein SETIT_3G327500v2 [Setaria italica]
MKLSSTLSVTVALLATFVILVLSSIVWLPSRQKQLNLPPGPWGWPVFGSLGFLAGALLPHCALAALAARHGPLMHLRLGSFHAVVVSSAEAARLVLKTHDLTFADRPLTSFGKIIVYGYKGILETPNGPYWRMAWKLCATELLSVRRVESFEHVRTEEMRALVHGLSECAGAIMPLRERLLSHRMRNTLRMYEAFAVTGTVSNLGEWVPWLGWLDVQGFVRRMKRVHELFKQFFKQILNEHEKDYRKSHDARASAEFVARDLVDVLLRLVEEGDDMLEEQEARLTRDGVKAFIHDIMIGGMKNTAVTIERWVTERDLPDLPYSDALVKETIRLHPASPIMFPHRAREDTVVGGYDIPAGTRVLVNAWAMARNPASWPDALDAFRPERFLAGGSAEGVDVRGAHFQLLPFGSGHRMCPAYNLALKEVAAPLANLEEFFGLSMSLKVPLVTVPKCRLPAYLYATVD